MRPNSAKNDFGSKNIKAFHRPIWSARANGGGKNVVSGSKTAELKCVASVNQSDLNMKSTDSPGLGRS